MGLKQKVGLPAAGETYLLLTLLISCNARCCSGDRKPGYKERCEGCLGKYFRSVLMKLGQAALCAPRNYSGTWGRASRLPVLRRGDVRGRCRPACQPAGSCLPPWQPGSAEHTVREGPSAAAGRCSHLADGFSIGGGEGRGRGGGTARSPPPAKPRTAGRPSVPPPPPFPGAHRLPLTRTPALLCPNSQGCVTRLGAGPVESPRWAGQHWGVLALSTQGPLGWLPIPVASHSYLQSGVDP